MKLVLFRHGIAMDRELALLQNIDDSKRPLVPRGRERTEKMAKFLKDSDEEFDLIVSSPLHRARQTAEILCQHVKYKKLMECPELVPSAPSQAFAQWLKTHAQGVTRILVVGHEPQLSVFASWCLAGSAESFIDLKKSGIICLEVEALDQISAKSADLLWVTSPKLVN